MNTLQNIFILTLFTINVLEARFDDVRLIKGMMHKYTGENTESCVIKKIHTHGFFHKNMFEVSFKGIHYILKETWKNNHKADKWREMQQYITDKSDVQKILNLPVLQYVTRGRYFTLMTKAPGKLLCEIIQQLIKKSTEHAELTQRAFFELGVTLATLHTQGEFDEPSFSSKLTHGDIQGANLFYDPRIGFTFIDNEEIPISKHCNVTDDIKKYFMKLYIYPYSILILKQCLWQLKMF